MDLSKSSASISFLWDMLRINNDINTDDFINNRIKLKVGGVNALFSRDFDEAKEGGLKDDVLERESYFDFIDDEGERHEKEVIVSIRDNLIFELDVSYPLSNDDDDGGYLELTVHKSSNNEISSLSDDLKKKHDYFAEEFFVSSIFKILGEAEYIGVNTDKLMAKAKLRRQEFKGVLEGISNDENNQPGVMR